MSDDLIARLYDAAARHRARIITPQTPITAALVEEAASALEAAHQENVRLASAHSDFRAWVLDGDDVPESAAWRMQVMDAMRADLRALQEREERLRTYLMERSRHLNPVNSCDGRIAEVLSRIRSFLSAEGSAPTDSFPEFPSVLDADVAPTNPVATEEAES